MAPSRTRLASGAACAVLFAASLSATDFQTLRGDLVSPACEAAPSPAGESRGARLMRCARSGEPMALRTADGLYAIEGDYTANKNAKLLDFVAKPVEAKGRVREEDGQKAINVAAMMVVK